MIPKMLGSVRPPPGSWKKGLSVIFQDPDGSVAKTFNFGEQGQYDECPVKPPSGAPKSSLSVGSFTIGPDRTNQVGDSISGGTTTGALDLGSEHTAGPADAIDGAHSAGRLKEVEDDDDDDDDDNDNDGVQEVDQSGCASGDDQDGPKGECSDDERSHCGTGRGVQGYKGVGTNKRWALMPTCGGADSKASSSTNPLQGLYNSH